MKFWRVFEIVGILLAVLFVGYFAFLMAYVV